MTPFLLLQLGNQPLHARIVGQDFGSFKICGEVAFCIAYLAVPYYNAHMKTLTVRLPEGMVAQIEAESRGRKLSKSDVVRERLSVAAGPSRRRHAPLDAIADLVGSVNGLPADLSARKKAYLKTTDYGQKRGR